MQTFGGTTYGAPITVARPERVSDVQRAIGDARARGLALAVRGQGHATGAHVSVPGGLLIDMRSMARVGDVEGSSVWVEAGARWRQVVDATLRRGLVPPTLTGYLDVTVGGTLAVGGFGAESFRAGAQVDNVLELEVVTGTNEVVRCSRDRDPSLFDAVRGGLGQFGVVTGARLALEPAPRSARVIVRRHESLVACLREMADCVAERHVAHVSAAALEAPGGYRYELAVVRYDPRAGADDLDGEVRDIDFASFVARTDAVVEEYQRAGLWDVPHPWIDVILPAEKTERFVGGELAALDGDELGGGLVLLTPLARSQLHAPLLRVPDAERLVLFDVLRNASPPTSDRATELRSRNRTLYERAVAVGGTLYPIGDVTLGPDDWRHHFGERWPAVQAAKNQFDPERRFGAGLQIFDPEPTR